LIPELGLFVQATCARIAILCGNADLASTVKAELFSALEVLPMGQEVWMAAVQEVREQRRSDRSAAAAAPAPAVTPGTAQAANPGLDQGAAGAQVL
jgi:hypothetical protein